MPKYELSRDVMLGSPVILSEGCGAAMDRAAMPVHNEDSWLLLGLPLRPQSRFPRPAV